jgi:hypothetical protein
MRYGWKHKLTPLSGVEVVDSQPNNTLNACTYHCYFFAFSLASSPCPTALRLAQYLKLSGLASH